MGVGVFTSILTYIKKGNKYKIDIEDRKYQYTKYIKKKERQIVQFREEEKKLLEKKYIADPYLLSFTRTLIFDSRDPEDVIGIPIGNYTSQFFANI